MKLISIEELMKDAKPCNLFDRIHEELLKEYSKPEYRAKELQKANEIAKLMHQVVGAEI